MKRLLSSLATCWTQNREAIVYNLSKTVQYEIPVYEHIKIMDVKIVNGRLIVRGLKLFS